MDALKVGSRQNTVRVDLAAERSGECRESATQLLHNVKLRHLWQSISPRFAHSLPAACGKQFQKWTRSFSIVSRTLPGVSGSV
jgi:hypothetical protein